MADEPRAVAPKPRASGRVSVPSAKAAKEVVVASSSEDDSGSDGGEE